jgi:N6-L-threonylcarbamoyladenine synthase
MKILGIETSCDETAISLIDASGDFGNDFSFTILGNSLLSQVAEHEKYGGVFPNVAKREHGRNLTPVLGEVFRQAKLLDTSPNIPEETIKGLEGLLVREPDLNSYLSSFLRSIGKPPIDALAVTVGPGLEPALWVGINFARALSKAWNVPIVPVNHMEGHIILSHIGEQKLSQDTNYTLEATNFPLLALLISGGHTELALSEKWMHYTIIGQTRDDAVGEAFDKAARLMGMKYPGGPEISRLAEEIRATGTKLSVSLPRPMIDSDNYDFSFSGLKTAVRNFVAEHTPLSDELRKAIAKEFEDAATDVLTAKTMRAIEEFGAETLVLGGGVSANTHIRNELSANLQTTNCKLLLPSPELATDNALMIALAGYFHAIQNKYVPGDSLVARGNLRLGSSI